MPRHDYQCDCGAAFERVTSRFEPLLACPSCDRLAGRVYLQRSDTHAVSSDEIDVVIENGLPEPRRFTSKAELLAVQAAHGNIPYVRHMPLPGTDKSAHTSDWGRGIDAYTLNAARELVARKRTRPQREERTLVKHPFVPRTFGEAEIGPFLGRTV